MIRWRLLLEDFNPLVKQIVGESNLLIDALSQLEMKYEYHDLVEWKPPREPL